MSLADDDLRDLLWCMGLTPIEIEVHLANPYTRALLETYMEAISKRIAQRLAQSLIEQLFPEGTQA